MSPVRNGCAVRAIQEYAYGKTKNVEQNKTQQKNKQSKAEQWSTVEFKAKQSNSDEGNHQGHKQQTLPKW